MSTEAIRRSGQGERWLFAGMVVVALGVLAFFAGQRQTQLRADVTGFDGLSSWLNAGDIPTQNFTGGWQIDPSDIGLNILPIYDTQIGRCNCKAARF